MNALTIDTSSNSACLGLFNLSNKASVKTLYKLSWNKKRSHSEVITSFFNNGLDEAGISAKDIELICLGIGPGSFTGIRVALNFAKTLSYSLNIPIYTVDSLLPLAYKYKDEADHLLVLNNAFRNMIYGTFIQSHPFKAMTETFACAPNKILEHLPDSFTKNNYKILGDAIEIYKDYLPSELTSNEHSIQNFSPDKCSESLLNCYLQDKSPELKKWNQVVPLYIRGSEAEEKLKKN